MANPLIKIKRSSVAGKVPHYPSQIDLGELAINIADGKVFTVAGQAGVGVGTTVIQVGVSTQTILSGVATITTLSATSLTVTNEISGISSGASKVETATDAGNQWHYVGYLDNQTGYQKIKTNGLTYNPNIGKLYAGIGSFDSVTGNLTGNINSTGVSTVAFLQATTINATGIVTASSFSGTLTGNVTGNIIGNVTGNINSTGVSTAAFLQATTVNVSAAATIPTLSGTTATFTRVTANGGFTGNINSSGISTISGFTFPSVDGTNGQVLGTDGAGNLSFISASTAGSGTTVTNLTWTVGVGSTAFQSNHDIAEDTTIVFNNGLKLALTNDYYINSNTIFITNGPLQQNDRVHATIHYNTTFDSEVFTATANQLTFPLAASILSSQDKAKVYLNGVKLRNEIDYTISQTIVLTLPAEAEDFINISSDSGDSYTTASAGQTSFGFTSAGISASNLMVYQNGIRLEPEDYSIGSLSVVLIFAAAAGDTLEVLLYT